MAVKAIPEGFRTVTPHLVIKDAGKAIDFYKKAFGAEEIVRMPGPDGQSVMHAEIKIGDSVIMICEECPEYGAKSPLALNGTPVTIHLYVENADTAFNKAVKAGAKAEMPVSDTFWGDRYGKLSDPFGHHWSVATHVKDVTPEQCAKAAAEMFAKGPC
jgi:uncharacterized glyoxalase superfamily protein PhnB